MSHAAFGLIYCLAFVGLEAFQAVYLGAVFQSVDSFAVGGLVFGISVIGCTVATALFRPAELAAAIRAWRVIVLLNVIVTVTWSTYFFAIQLVEPAIAFTVFSGMVPLGTVIAGWLGLPEAASKRQRLENAGYAIILLSIIALAAITVFGFSGFVRGGWMAGFTGVALAAVSGGFTALVILFSVRLNGRGVGPLPAFGLRFILYTVLSMLAFLLGLDDKGTSVPAGEMVRIVFIGLLVIAYPLYLLQKAIPLVHASVIAAFAALGPVIVFVMQLVEGRVDYAIATLTGTALYMVGALLAIHGATRNTREPLVHAER
ncbi:hypothetical protein [Hoeflea sp.]|uniref:hypothetical protein n=1 Tax=Hoeflea sp. TaxID=1940281 RepID=UPI003B027975